VPITDHYARLPLNLIAIDRDGRQRRKLETRGLLESIKLRGVLNPIIVERATDQDGKHKLTAGERRYQASSELGLPDIPVRFADELSFAEAQIFELEENIKRQNLTWQDEARAIQRIHVLYCELDTSWTQDKTTWELGFTKGTISVHLTVANNLDINENARNATSLREAYNIITRKAEREAANEMDRILYGAPLTIPGASPAPSELPVETPSTGFIDEAPRAAPPLVIHDYRIDGNPAKNILLESFLMWAPKYTGPAFNLIHCDFPYGISVFGGPQSGVNRHQSYDDSREIHFQLLETLLIHFDRLASTSCHVIYWFSMQHYNQIKQMVAELAPELIIQTHPLIWHKTDNSGIASDPRHGPRHIYETALLMSRGKRPIVRMTSDVYGCPTDHELHIHTKPEPMLRYFFGMLVDEHTVFLDPTCGSGSSIRAAESLGARTVVGMDTDETTVGQARMALRQARAKRTAAASGVLSL
jgi:ParB/RepB/Spo0J family partition protein